MAIGQSQRQYSCAECIDGSAGRLFAGLPAVTALECLLATYSLHRSKNGHSVNSHEHFGMECDRPDLPSHLHSRVTNATSAESSLTQSQLSALANGFLHSNPSPGSCTNWVDEHVTADLVTGIDPRNSYHMFNIFQPIPDTVLRQQASMHGVSLLQFLA